MDNKKYNEMTDEELMEVVGGYRICNCEGCDEPEVVAFYGIMPEPIMRYGIVPVE